MVDLATLIHHVARVPGIERIRFTTSHPLEFNDSLIEAYASVGKLANHLHLPVQSGSDRVLALMKRGYTTLEFKDKRAQAACGTSRHRDLHRFHRRFPRRERARFRGDARARRARWGSTSHSASSTAAAPGTPAASLPDEVPSPLKQERLVRLQAQLEAQARAISRRMVGSVQRVLVERTAKRDARELAGRTENNRWVNFAGPAVLMRPLRRCDRHRSALAHSLRGRLTDTGAAAQPARLAAGA